METWVEQVGRIPFNQQIRNFEETLDQITEDEEDEEEVRDAVGRSIFFVGMGSNDYLNNYLMPNYPTRNQFTAQQYADLLIQQYSRQLTVSTPHPIRKTSFLIHTSKIQGGRKS